MAHSRHTGTVDSAKSFVFRNTRILWLVGLTFGLAFLLHISSTTHISEKFRSIISQSQSQSQHSTGHKEPAASAIVPNTRSKYAYVTLLGRDALHNETDINEDTYFKSMRTLGWSLLHAEESKSSGIPFVVLAVPGVNPEKVSRLEKDGATVLHVEPIPLPTWLPPKPMIPQWQDCWTKLRLFELEQFEKVIFLDADIIVAGQLDIVFEKTQIRQSVKSRAGALDHTATIPEDYVFSAGLETSVNHHFPPSDKELEKGQYFNAGFFVARPGLAILDHYLSVLNTPNSFNHIALEQNLFNEVHRQDGAMPFQQLDWKYNAYRPTQEDVDAGALSYHAKYWLLDHKELTDYMTSFVWKALGYYEAQDALGEV